MRLLGYLVLPLAAVAAYLLFWPVPIEPAHWAPPPLPAAQYPYNERLRAVGRLAEGVGQGPEALAFVACIPVSSTAGSCASTPTAAAPPCWRTPAAGRWG
jgi:hypothetical protein